MPVRWSFKCLALCSLPVVDAECCCCSAGSGEELGIQPEAPQAPQATVIPGADSLIGDLLDMDLGPPMVQQQPYGAPPAQAPASVSTHTRRHEYACMRRHTHHTQTDLRTDRQRHTHTHTHKQQRTLAYTATSGVHLAVTIGKFTDMSR